MDNESVELFERDFLLEEGNIKITDKLERYGNIEITKKQLIEFLDTIISEIKKYHHIEDFLQLKDDINLVIEVLGGDYQFESEFLDESYLFTVEVVS